MQSGTGPNTPAAGTRFLNRGAPVFHPQTHRQYRFPLPASFIHESGKLHSQGMKSLAISLRWCKITKNPCPSSVNPNVNSVSSILYHQTQARGSKQTMPQQTQLDSVGGGQGHLAGDTYLDPHRVAPQQPPRQ